MAKLLSVITYCFEAAFWVGSRTAWIWLGAIAFAILGWLLMQSWLRAWNLQWNGTLPTGLCLVCALTFALAAFVIVGAINLETFLVREVEQTGERLCKSSDWGIETFQKSLSTIGLRVSDSKQVELQNAGQLEALRQATETSVRRAFTAQFPNLLASDPPALLSNASDPEVERGFSVNLDSYFHWAEQAIDRQVQTGVQQVRAFAQRITSLAIRTVAAACLLFNGLLAIGAACCAYRAIFQPAYRAMTIQSIL